MTMTSIAARRGLIPATKRARATDASGVERSTEVGGTSLRWHREGVERGCVLVLSLAVRSPSAAATGRSGRVRCVMRLRTDSGTAGNRRSRSSGRSPCGRSRIDPHPTRVDRGQPMDAAVSTSIPTKPPTTRGSPLAGDGDVRAGDRHVDDERVDLGRGRGSRHDGERRPVGDRARGAGLRRVHPDQQQSRGPHRPQTGLRLGSARLRRRRVDDGAHPEPGSRSSSSGRSSAGSAPRSSCPPCSR